MVLRGEAPSGAPRRGVGAGKEGASKSGGNDVDARTGTAPVASPIAAPVIDLSATSLGDDPFLDSLEVAERQRKIAPSRKSKTSARSSNSIVDRKKRKTVGVSSSSSSSSSGGGGGDSSGSGSGSAGEATGRRHPAARPLTSISALFGGGGGGNRANRAGGSIAAPPRPRAGTKRPRANPAAGQSRMVPPLPPPAATGAVLPVGRASKPTQQSRRDGRLAANGICGVGGGGGRGPQEAAAAGGRGGRGEAGEVEDQLWPDKHRPRDVSDLAVHSKKVDEVRHWMTQALTARPGSEGACRLLALVGPPGSAKSTMVRLLAQDMDVELAEWQDTSGQGGPAYRPFSDGPALGGDRPRHELGSSYQSAIDSFEEFMKRSSYRALPILAVKSKKHGAGSGEETSSSSGRTGGGIGSGSGGGGRGKRRRIVLIEELPEVYGEEKKARLRNLMAECARSSPSPVIICWSQASESSSYQSRLEQVLSRETLRIPGVQITTCNPINATLLRQHLKAVLVLEGVSDPRGTLVQSAITTCAGDIRHALLNLQMSVGGGRGVGPRASAFAKKSNGGGGGSQSKRGGTSRKKRDARTIGGGSSKAGTAAAPGPGARDTFLTQFHALGKLLYAKRLPPPDPADAVAALGKAGRSGTAAAAAAGSGGAGGEESLRRGQLAFVPEEVLSQGGMELDWALAFLQYHCVDFFTDESDLSQGLGYFSDADLFASRMFDSSRGYDGGGEQAVFPQRYAESIASRATAATNRHPAKSRMRAFGAPKSFEMRRSRIEAAAVLRRFVGDAWDASGGDEGALWASSRHLKEAVDTDLLPMARLITGEWEAEAALRSLLHRFMQDREQQHRPPRSSARARAGLTGGSLPHPGDAAAPAISSERVWGGDGGGGKGGRRENDAGDSFWGEASSGAMAASVACAEEVEAQQVEEEDEIRDF